MKISIILLNNLWNIAGSRLIKRNIITSEEFDKLKFGNFVDNFEFEDKEIDIDAGLLPSAETCGHFVRPREASKTIGRGLNKKGRCMARAGNDMYGGQCSRKAKEDEYCLGHNNVIKKHRRLHYGRIDEKRVNYAKDKNGKIHKWKIPEEEESNLISSST
jgi:hypothetical protein